MMHHLIKHRVTPQTKHTIQVAGAASRCRDLQATCSLPLLGALGGGR
jgi:hypothetical protein